MGQKNRPNMNPNSPSEESDLNSESWDDGRIQFEREDIDDKADVDSPSSKNYKAGDARRPTPSNPSPKSH